MQIKRVIKGHEFAVQLRAVERAGQLANGAPAYTAHATIYRDGRDIGSGRWSGEGFACAMVALPDAHESDDVWRELAVAIREHLAALPVETRADVATTFMQRVTFAPGLRGDELRAMAAYVRELGVAGAPPAGSAWRALADALDAAAEQGEAGNAPEAP